MAELYTMARKWNQFKHPFTDGRINKMWTIHTMEYYPAIEKKEELKSGTTWINVDNVLQCGRTQAQNVTYCMVLS